MKVANVVEKVVEMDQPVCPVLYRSFVQSEYSLLIVRRMNDFLQQYTGWYAALAKVGQKLNSLTHAQ